MIGNARISFYFSHQRVDKDNGPDGWPYPISKWRYQEIRSKTIRLNLDHPLTPTLFLHMGAGLLWYNNPDQQVGQDYDASALGLKGTLHTGFPTMTIQNINPSANLAMGNQISVNYITKPTGDMSLTRIRGNHTYKYGAQLALEATSRYSYIGGVGNYVFGTPATSYGVSYNLGGGYIGNGYASFLLGYANNGAMGPMGGVGYRRTVWGFFAQDTWKATRKLTHRLRRPLRPAACAARDVPPHGLLRPLHCQSRRGRLARGHSFRGLGTRTLQLHLRFHLSLCPRAAPRRRVAGLAEDRPAHRMGYQLLPRRRSNHDFRVLRRFRFQYSRLEQPGRGQTGIPAEGRHSLPVGRPLCEQPDSGPSTRQPERRSRPARPSLRRSQRRPATAHSAMEHHLAAGTDARPGGAGGLCRQPRHLAAERFPDRLQRD